MPDPVTNAALIASIAPLAHQVLGDSAKYLGGELKLFTESNVNNIKAILNKAKAKPSAENANGNVSPSVIKDLIFDASFSEDTISQEYYAGLLISSKTKDSLDNRGKTISSLISNLSTYQLTAHYILYGILWATHGEDVSTINDLASSFVDNDHLIALFNLSDPSDAQGILDHVLSGLQKHNLIKGIDEVNRYRGLKIDGQYNFVHTPSGIELFLWANGLGRKDINYFCSPQFSPEILQDLDFNEFI